MLSTDNDILKAAEDWRKKGRAVALATVVETWGSAPRPVGSNLVIDEEGNFLGSVSGGCVEGAVVTEALDVIESGKARMLEFGVADETAWKVGLSCGGTIRVYVEKVSCLHTYPRSVIRRCEPRLRRASKDDGHGNVWRETNEARYPRCVERRTRRAACGRRHYRHRERCAAAG